MKERDVFFQGLDVLQSKHDQNSQKPRGHDRLKHLVPQKLAQSVSEFFLRENTQRAEFVAQRPKKQEEQHSLLV